MTAPELADGYYAVPDPDDPAMITCWRWSSTGRKRGLRRWSGGVRYGEPTGPSRSRPPRPWTTADRQAAADWFREVHAAVHADPAAAQDRFAAITGSCYSCGRKLTDPQSVALGIGPDCRREVPR